MKRLEDVVEPGAESDLGQSRRQIRVKHRRERDDMASRRKPTSERPATEGLERPFVLTDRGSIRICELLRLCDPRDFRERFGPPSRWDRAPLFSRVCQVLRERDGIDLIDLNYDSLESVSGPVSAELDGATAAAFLSATSHHLRSYPGIAPFSWEDFEARVNEILASDGNFYRLVATEWRSSVGSDTEVLRRILLRGDDEAAGCRQGDQQVEIVVSTIQERLSRDGALLVDYGAGLGRVLAGLAQAKRFRSATYVAVDEPIPQAVRKLAETTGATSQFVSRTHFLEHPVEADVVMVVNTLHHMAFAEIPIQLERLVSALKPGGVLLVHEMGILRDPEQRNVPWRFEDLYGLFAGSCFKINGRSTASRTGVGLANVLISRTDEAGIRDALEGNVRNVWAQMKTRTLAEIAELYGSRDETRHIDLQHLLILNANLDLNPPTAA